MATPRPVPLSPEAFARHFEASARLLWTVAAAVLGSRHAVEDVLQEAAVIGLEKLDQYTPGTRFDAWMGRIVRYVSLNHLRRRARRAEVGDDALPAVTAPSTPSPLDAIEPFDDELEAALAELRPTARACLLLKVVGGLEYKEIAATLEVPEGTAMSHVHRARKQLALRLEQTEEATR